MSDIYEVVVVGAGASGMTAAYRLKNSDSSIKIAVLEGKDHVGGRTLTVPMVAKHGSDVWDLGGQWVGSCQVHVMHLLKELGLETYTQFHKGAKAQQICTDKVTTYDGQLPDLSWLALIDLYRFMAKCDKYRSELLITDPYDHPRAAEWDAITLEAFLDQTLYTKGSRGAILAALRCMLGCEADQVSFMYFLLYIQMADGFERMIESSKGSGQEFKVKGGTQQISQILADRVGKEVIHLGDPVVSIKEIQDEDCLIVETRSGEKRKARYVILALPPCAAEQIDFTPSLSPERRDFSKRAPMGSIIKVIVTYENTFWRDNNLSGEAVSDGGCSNGPGSAMKPLCVCYDATSPNGNPAIVAFLGGQAAVEWRKQSAMVRKEAVINHLCEFYGQASSQYLDYQEKDWSEEPLTWGGPVTVLPPGTMYNFGLAIRQSEGRIHFAGTETATSWSGYINGAVEAGERAAAEVASRLRPGKPLPYQTKLSGDRNHVGGKRRKPRGRRSRVGMMSFLAGIGLACVAAFFVQKGALAGVWAQWENM